MIDKRVLLQATLAMTAAAFCGTAQAQDWKPEQVTIVLPHGVGGGQDRLTREFGAVWEKHLGVPVVYENVSGASGRRGYDYFLNQPTDGSFVMSSNLASASIMYVQQEPDWNWNESVHPIGLFGVDPGAFFTHEDTPYDSFEELLDAARESPVTFGLAFWASPDNLVAHQVAEIADAEFQVVPIGGGSDTVTAVLGGHVQAGFTKLTNIMKNDEMRFLAISMDTNPIPGKTNDAPTVSEALDEPTLSVASYRSITLHQDTVDNHPEVAQWLKQTMEAAKDDPEYIEAATREGMDADLIVDMNHEEIRSIIESYWDAYDRLGHVYEEG